MGDAGVRIHAVVVMVVCVVEGMGQPCPQGNRAKSGMAVCACGGYGHGLPDTLPMSRRFCFSCRRVCGMVGGRAAATEGVGLRLGLTSELDSSVLH